MSDEWFVCPHCGAKVKAKALSCPECGADDSTGWSDGAEYSDDPIADFDYEESMESEFGDSKKRLAIVGCDCRRLLLLLCFELSALNNRC